MKLKTVRREVAIMLMSRVKDAAYLWKDQLKGGKDIWTKRGQGRGHRQRRGL